MVSCKGNRDFAAQPKRNRAKTASPLFLLSRLYLLNIPQNTRSARFALFCSQAPLICLYILCSVDSSRLSILSQRLPLCRLKKLSRKETRPCNHTQTLQPHIRNLAKRRWNERNFAPGSVFTQDRGARRTNTASMSLPSQVLA